MDFDIINGEGRFIFFLHGWGGNKNSFSFIKNYLNFSSRNLVFVSFSGFGLSPSPQKPYFIEDYVEELKELIVNVAKGKKVDIVCHSFGGRVASVLASAYPELINSIFMIDVAGIKPRRGLKYHIRVLKYKHAKKLVNKGKLEKNALLKYGSSDYKNLDGIMRQTFVNIVNQDLADNYRNIKCPVFIFWGKDDKETPLYMARKIRKLIKNSTLRIIDNAGHFSYIDNLDSFLFYLSDFLQKCNAIS